MNNQIKYIIWFSIIALLIGCNGTEGGGWDNSSAVNEKQYIVIRSKYIGTHDLQFYINFGVDSAILGFSTNLKKNGRRVYFPLHASTYRGIPPVMLDLYVSESNKELWIRSSWPGYSVLAYYKLGNSRCLTQYGDVAALDTPSPSSLVGGPPVFPEMIVQEVTKVASFKYEGR